MHGQLCLRIFQTVPTFLPEHGKRFEGPSDLEGGFHQYVYHLLSCSPTQDISNVNIVLILNFFTNRKYEVSKNKTQVSLQKFHYPGYVLTPRKWRLSTERTFQIYSLELSWSKHQLHSFLGVAGFSQIWYPTMESQSTYEATKEWPWLTRMSEGNTCYSTPIRMPLK
jgi:hypothetical protein